LLQETGSAYNAFALVPQARAMTLDDVARKAGVSTATVSRVLNQVGPVRSATRGRVLQAIKDLNYQPNLHARSLAGGRSHALGLIVSNIENPFFLDIYHALEAAARERGYEVVIASTGYSPGRLMSSLRQLLARRPAGLAFIVSENDPALPDELRRAKVPTVFYDIAVPGPSIRTIAVDYRSGMQRIVDYLRSLGHRRMAFIGHHTTLGPLNARKTAFVEAVQAGGPSLEHAAVAAEDSPEGGRLAVRQLLAAGARPTAIVCVNDHMAMGVLRELADQRLSVPGDVSVTGFDNIGLSSFTCPRLTTADIPRELIGRTAFSLLVPEAGGISAALALPITPELIVRESTGPCPS
jgi:DNA-binding LacI/PurR family transcriptional regulator